LGIISGASPSKIDTSVESLPSESQIVENNIPYDTNQQAMLRGWPSEIVPTGMPVQIMPMAMHPGMMMNADDLMRGPPPNQPPREYQVSIFRFWVCFLT